MCGIAGLTDRENFHLIPTLLDTLRHRGPDDQGDAYFKEDGVALGMRRLSILDVSSGRQPMSNENDRIWVVFNGEIFNSPELRKGLIAKGHRFKTDHSDTEVLVHLYEEKGAEMVSDLNGMFAFVLYDADRKELFGARDRMGIKPFYYTLKNGKFAFASELKSLLRLPWVSKDLHFPSLYHYLGLQFVPSPDSIFSDIKKLPAGSRFVYRLKDQVLRIDRYWDLPIKPRLDRTLGEWKNTLRQKMEEALDRWTLSDVPIACSLSGGLDSSAIVGLLAKRGKGRLVTYSLGFEGEGSENYNELALARIGSARWGTEHHEFILNPQQILQDLEPMVRHLDEPYGGGLPSWYIYRTIGEKYKVALTGTGGDELFGNYLKAKRYLFPSLFRFVQSMKNAPLSAWPRGAMDAIRYPHGFYYHGYASDGTKIRWLAEAHRQKGIHSTAALLDQRWSQSPSGDPRDAVAFVDFHMQLPEEFLHVTDRFSMAHSVEARVPFLDHELVETVYQVPASLRVRMTDPKYLLRELVADVLPPEHLSAPKKGFILPLPRWTRKELAPTIRQFFSPDYLKRQGIFTPAVWSELVEPHLEGRIDRTQQVWTLFMFQYWYSVYIEAK